MARVDVALAIIALSKFSAATRPRPHGVRCHQVMLQCIPAGICWLPAVAAVAGIAADVACSQGLPGQSVGQHLQCIRAVRICLTHAGPDHICKKQYAQHGWAECLS